MVPDEWPIAPPAVRVASPARRAGRRRLPIVQQDFFLDPAKRLTEQERALMTAMLADLIGTIADELGAVVTAPMGAANDEDGHHLLLLLSAAGQLDHPELISLLLRRADEERIAAAMRSRSGGHPAFLQALVADSDASTAGAAMGLILARGARRDRLGQPRLQFDDLSPNLAADLVYRIAAALRPRLVPPLSTDQADRQLAAAVDQLLARRSPDKSMTRLTRGLVTALHSAGKLGEPVIKAAAEEGDVSFVAEALAEMAGVLSDESWDRMVDGGDGRLMLLFRMAGVSRTLAAGILGILADLIGIDHPGAEITRFDAIGDAEAERVRLSLQLNPAYHEALSALGKSDGERTF
ncbi:MAG TPA: DUF2336 domain-containing protein [Sphingomicrobium sp.]|nr:DUF2336 domain-containing protein [Sphingomicrobium sp.]